MTGVARQVDQPQQHTKQRQNDNQEKHGEEPHLFLVKGRVAFALIVTLKEHALFYSKPAPSANWF